MNFVLETEENQSNVENLENQFRDLKVTEASKSTQKQELNVRVDMSRFQKALNNVVNDDDS